MKELVENREPVRASNTRLNHRRGRLVFGMRGRPVDVVFATFVVPIGNGGILIERRPGDDAKSGVNPNSFHRVASEVDGDFDRSKLVVQSYGADGDGTAVAVVAGVVDAGEAEAECEVLLELAVVVRLDDLLGTVVESPVADDEADAAGGEVIAVCGRQAVEQDRHAELVVGPLPPLALHL